MSDFKQSLEHRLAIGNGLRKAYQEGRHKTTHTLETKKKISLSKVGKIGYWARKRRPEITGENHYNWKGGSKHLERVMFKTQMQRAVFERDDYTCQLCGVRGAALQVDHIRSWAEYVDLRFNINNCRTLCQKCHYKITFGKPMLREISTWGHNLHNLKEVISNF